MRDAIVDFAEIIGEMLSEFWRVLRGIRLWDLWVSLPALGIVALMYWALSLAIAHYPPEECAQKENARP